MPLTPATTGKDPGSRSSLDPSETTVLTGSLPYLPAPQWSDYDRESVRFRHSRWTRKRDATYHAIWKTAGHSSRLDRFERCGTAAWVLRSKEPPERYRLACFRCHDRLCDPCAHERRLTISRNLHDAVKGRHLRLLTLTLKSTDAPLGEQIDRLYLSFRKLRQTRELKPRIAGGLFFLELTLSATTRQWHPHLHVIVEGDFLPHPVLRALWLEITGDSFIVDVRQLRGEDEAASYVCKYATKTLSAHVWTDPEKYAEAADALQGRRTFHVFGSWRKLHLGARLPDTEGWIAVAPLAELMQRAAQGDRPALEILRALCRMDALEPLPHPPRAVP